jgi:hypothetical protein
MNSDSPSTSIQKHTGTYGTFSFDLSQAKGGSGSNPFGSVSATDSTGSSGAQPASPSSSSSADACVNQDSTSSRDAPGGSSTVNGGSGNNTPQSSGASGGSASSGSGSSPTAGPVSGPAGSAGQGPVQQGNPPWGNGPPPFAVNGGFPGPGFPGVPGPWNHPGHKSGFPPMGPPLARRAGGNSPCNNLNANRGSNGGKSPQNVDSSKNTLAVYSKPNTKIVAHAVLACLSFGLLFPIGAITMRLLHIPGLIWIHGAFQLFTAFLFTLAFALGITLAKDLNYVSPPSIWILYTYKDCRCGSLTQLLEFYFGFSLCSSQFWELSTIGNISVCSGEDCSHSHTFGSAGFSLLWVSSMEDLGFYWQITMGLVPLRMAFLPGSCGCCTFSH